MIRRLKTAVTMQRSATIPYVPHLTLLTNIDINIAERNHIVLVTSVCVSVRLSAQKLKKKLSIGNTRSITLHECV